MAGKFDIEILNFSELDNETFFSLSEKYAPYEHKHFYGDFRF